MNATPTTLLPNGSDVEYETVCPVHGTPKAKEYGFGKWAKAPCPEAWVTTYRGCRCAVCTHGASLRKMYFHSYEGAASEARYTVQRLNARY